MKLFWRIAVPVIFVATLSVAGLALQAYKAKVSERKLVDAAHVCRASAEQGNAKAEFSLARMYYHGQGVPQDYTEALRWYRKAADQGDAMAQYNLGCMYYDGKGVAQHYIEAVRWYRKAVDQSDARAQYSLGTMYYYGRGVPQDRAMAAHLYRQAADQGLARAQYDLGYLYYYGQEVPQDRIEANRWFRKAADQGSTDAQHALGVGFTKWRVFILLALLSGGILLTVGVLIPSKVRWSIQTKRATIAGLLCFFCAGFNWYRYTHFTISWMLFGFNAFSLFGFLLDAVLIVLSISILRSGVWRPAGGPGA